MKDQNSKACFLEEEFDKAIIGTGIKYGKSVVAAYSVDICLKILIEKHGCCEMEAYEKFEDSTGSKESEGNYPVFINDFRKIKLIDLENIDVQTTINKILGTNDPV